MTTETEHDLNAGRRQVPRTRGALSGLLLVILGAWAALAPFIGPYFNFGFTPRANDAWHWTSGRGWLEVLPGAVAVAGGLLLLLSSSRLMTLLGAWLGALAGAWLVVGTPLSRVLHLHGGGPDPSLRPGLMALERLLYFYGTGAAIVLIAGIALGRLSVHSVRDVRAAEQRAEQQAAEERRLAEEQRVGDEQRRAVEDARLRDERAREERELEERRRTETHHTGTQRDVPQYDESQRGTAGDTVVATHHEAVPGHEGVVHEHGTVPVQPQQPGGYYDPQAPQAPLPPNAQPQPGGTYEPPPAAPPGATSLDERR